MNWQPIANGGIKRTVSSEDLPTGTFLYSYEYGPWGLAVDPDWAGITVLSIDQLTSIVQKLKQLNEKDTHSGRDTYSERAEVEVPNF